MKISLSTSLSLILSYMAVFPASAQTMDPVEVLLSKRHLAITEDLALELESAAGDMDALVDSLLTLRHNSEKPYVALRAAEILVRYCIDESEPGKRSLAAVEADFSTPEYEGLARVYARNIDKVSSENMKQRLKSSAQARAARRPAFRAYVNPESAETTGDK
jgi:hypothetical protein